MELFDTNINKGASFSIDRKYRYVLWRIWETNGNKVAFIGLNPSTANEDRDDPTIRRCIQFAKAWGYGGIYMLNLYAFVSTNPDELLISGENINENNRFILKYARKSKIVIFAWGCFKQHRKRMDQIIDLFNKAYCIKHSKEGYPGHPLYLPGNLKPVPFKKE